MITHRYYEVGKAVEGETRDWQDLEYTPGQRNRDLPTRVLNYPEKTSFNERVGAVSAALLPISDGHYGFVQLHRREESELGHKTNRRFNQQRWSLLTSDEIAQLVANGYGPYFDLLVKQPTASDERRHHLRIYQREIGEIHERQITLTEQDGLLYPLADRSLLGKVAFWIAERFFQNSFIQIKDTGLDFITKLSLVQAVQHILQPYLSFHPDHKSRFDHGILTFALDYISTRQIPLNFQFYRQDDELAISAQYSPENIELSQFEPEKYVLKSPYLRFASLIFHRLDWQQAVAVMSEPVFKRAIEAAVSDYESVRLQLGFRYPRLLDPDSLDEWAGSIILQVATTPHIPAEDELRLVPFNIWLDKLVFLPTEHSRTHTLLLERVLHAYRHKEESVSQSASKLSTSTGFPQRLQTLMSLREERWLSAHEIENVVLKLCCEVAKRDFSFAAWFMYNEAAEEPFNQSITDVLNTLKLPGPYTTHRSEDEKHLYWLLVDRTQEAPDQPSLWEAARKNEALFADYALPYALRHYHHVPYSDIEQLISLGRHDILRILVDQALFDTNNRLMLQELPGDTWHRWLITRRMAPSNDAYLAQADEHTTDHLYDLVKSLKPQDPDLILDVIRNELLNLPLSYAPYYSEYAEWMSFVEDDGQVEIHPIYQLAGWQEAKSIQQLVTQRDLYYLSTLYLADQGKLPVSDIMRLYGMLSPNDDVPANILNALYKATLARKKNPSRPSEDIEIPLDILLDQYSHTDLQRRMLTALTAFYLWHVARLWAEEPGTGRLQSGQAIRWHEIVSQQYEYSHYAYESSNPEGAKTKGNYLYDLFMQIQSPSEELIETVLLDVLPALDLDIDGIVEHSAIWAGKVDKSGVQSAFLQVLVGDSTGPLHRIFKDNQSSIGKLLLAVLYMIRQEQLPHVEDIHKIRGASMNEGWPSDLRDRVLDKVSEFKVSPQADVRKSGITATLVREILQNDELDPENNAYLRLYAFHMLHREHSSTTQARRFLPLKKGRDERTSESSETESLELPISLLDKWAELLKANLGEREKYRSRGDDFYALLVKRMQISVHTGRLKDGHQLENLVYLGLREIPYLPTDYNKYEEFKRWIDLLDKSEQQIGDPWLDTLVHRKYDSNILRYLLKSAIPQHESERKLMYFLSYAYMIDKNAPPYDAPELIRKFVGEININHDLLKSIRTNVDEVYLVMPW